MKQGLQLKFSQNLSLTPQLQQAIRLLQLSTLELNQEIDVLMQTNPLLERGDDTEDEYGNAVEPVVDGADLSPSNLEAGEAKQDAESFDVEYVESAGEFSGSESGVSSVTDASESAEFEVPTTEYADTFSAEFNDEFDEFSNGSRWDENTMPADDDSDFKPQETLQTSLREHLLSQLKLMPLSERDQSLVLMLVDSINDDGYLEQSLEEIAELMPEELEIDAIELQTALRHVQHLDPPGVGARSLSESLLLQLDVLPEYTPHLALASLVAKHYLPVLASRDFVKLRKELGCDEATLKQVQQLITSLNPRPGSAFSHIGSEHYIQHEVIVKKSKRHLDCKLK